jgi:hypothetical protein
VITHLVETTLRRGAPGIALALFVILAVACGETNAASGAAPDSGRTLAAPGASREEIDRTNEQIWRIRAFDLESEPTAEPTPVGEAYCAAEGAPCIEP